VRSGDTEQLLDALNAAKGLGAAAAGSGDLWDSAASTGGLGDAVLRGILGWLADRLSDYHANFEGDAATMKVRGARGPIRQAE
jgi:hypothetical protein